MRFLWNIIYDYSDVVIAFSGVRTHSTWIGSLFIYRHHIHHRWHDPRKLEMQRIVTITDEPSLSPATSRIHSHNNIRRRRRDRWSRTRHPAVCVCPRVTSMIETRHRQNAAMPMTTGRIWHHDSVVQIREHPMLPQQQPVSSNSASYVLSVSCLFLCGPLRRISVNARFYVQCCLVLWRGGCYGGPLQFPDESQA